MSLFKSINAQVQGIDDPKARIKELRAEIAQIFKDHPGDSREDLRTRAKLIRPLDEEIERLKEGSGKISQGTIVLVNPKDWSSLRKKSNGRGKIIGYDGPDGVVIKLLDSDEELIAYQGEYKVLDTDGEDWKEDRKADISSGRIRKAVRGY